MSGLICFCYDKDDNIVVKKINKSIVDVSDVITDNIDLVDVYEFNDDDVICDYKMTISRECN